jgi:DNA helicase-2/ATP-dependent DNA helicase PcrA
MASQILRACEKYGNERVLVASFTRAAAAEIGSRRGVQVPRHMIGTLHAHAYRTLGQPELAEKHLKDWNEFAADDHVMSAGGVDIDDMSEANFSSIGDEVMNRYHVMRALLRPRTLWDADVRFFAERWEAWKQQNEYVDFTDMIEMAIPLEHPGKPAIGFFDEAQDFTPLELLYVRTLAQSMEYLVMAGDDDQNLYAFKGATPDAFLDPPLPANQKRVLAQSWRIPSAVHVAASTWVSRLSRREPKEYLPREYEGDVRLLPSAREYGTYAPSYEAPDRLLEDAQQYLEAGKSVMFLGTCAYMVDPLKQQLRAEATPFHNPYRRKRGDWNPLSASRGVSVAQRLAAFLQYETTDWSPNDVLTWSEHCTAKIWKKGGKELVKTLPMQHRPIPGDKLAAAVTPDFLMGIYRGGLDFLYEKCLNNSHKSKYEFAMRVAKKHGAAALTDTPQVLIGTTHSVKGGEADVVYLFPDMSRAGYQEYLTHADSTIRQFYVGMTRAKETLVVANAAGPMSVRGLADG